MEYEFRSPIARPVNDHIWLMDDHAQVAPGRVLCYNKVR